MIKSGYFRFGLLALGVLAVYLFYRYRQPRFIAGETAPDFSVTLADGQKARLYDLGGKYVLLQFWGSWCGPCRSENPYLALMYHKYNAKGFEIFSVAIEQNPLAWKRAIDLDDMVWPYHTAEFSQFDGPVAQLYNIRSIPATFLLNPQHVIMGVNLSPDALDRMLSSALGNR